MKISFKAGVFAVIAGVLLVPATSSAYSREETSTGQGLYQSALPLNYYINVKCSDKEGGSGDDQAECVKAVKDSFITWTGPSCTGYTVAKPTMTERTDTGYDPEGKDNINLVVWRFEGWSQPPLDYPKSALAITTNVFYDKTGEVVKSDIEVNGEDYEWKVVEGPDKDHMDIQNTMTHEAGHVLGLGHSDDPNAVMYYSVKPGETSKRVLAQDDIDGVCAIYPKGVHPDAGAPDSGPQPDKPGGCSCSNAGL